MEGGGKVRGKRGEWRVMSGEEGERGGEGSGDLVEGWLVRAAGGGARR